LLYQLEQGPVEQKILEQCYRHNLPIPEKIKNAPEILPGLQFYYTAFYDLGSCRMGGMSEGEIPWVAVKSYAEWYELDEFEFYDFWKAIKQMDMVYLNYRASKRKK